MAQQPCSPAIIEAARKAVEKAGGNVALAARNMGIPRPTLIHRLRAGELDGKAPIPDSDMGQRERVGLQDRIRELEAEIKAIHRNELTDERVLDKVFGLRNTPLQPPSWAVETPTRADKPAIPCVLWSDWHWSENVRAAQVNGVNEYSLPIAKKRLRKLVAKTISLCFDHSVRTDYPGIVVNLGGDMISGDIHSELTETNDLASGPNLIDITESLIWALGQLADKFGRVWVVGVPGNHGRMTHKPRFKDRQFTNFDWIVYHFLRMHFRADNRLTFYIPEGADAHYRVGGHRFLLSHGDNLGVKGGDGIIGSLGPILRGDFKIRNSNAQMGLQYDTLLLGHWHQFLPLYPRLIVNGTLKGFDEFAMLALRAPPEPPSQALWFTHPKVGITSVMPVFVEERAKRWTGETVAFGMAEE